MKRKDKSHKLMRWLGLYLSILFVLLYFQAGIVKAEETGSNQESNLEQSVTGQENNTQPTTNQEINNGQSADNQQNNINQAASSQINPQAVRPADEFNAVWISYLEFCDRLKDPVTGQAGFTEARFQSVVNEMFDNVVKLKMNAVVVQVRPFADAMYPSKYFPWSKYISGTQGVNPGFDPLAYMIKAAHDRGLKFHAWINPFRITTGSTSINKLSADNIARIWRTDDDNENDRRVLSFGGSLYFNPSDIWVQEQIVDGVKEIVQNYDVDGIHFDDYFYPTLGSKYKKTFDYKEYNEDCKWNKENGLPVEKIADWRRGNVNRLVKNIYQAIKEIKPAVQFGISPGGFLDTLQMDDRSYSDIKTWLSSPGYVDYICPQLYWSFSHSKYPFDKILASWLAMKTNQNVKMYVGIAAYRAGSNLEKDWKNDPELLKKQVEYARSTGMVKGFIYFRYDFFYKAATKNGIEKLLEIL